MNHKTIVHILRKIAKLLAVYPKSLQDAQRAKFKSLIDKHNKGA
jgi:hypothetical protein